jgi:hypothetical protein
VRSRQNWSGINVFDTEKVLRLVMVVALYEERTITNAFHLHGTSYGLKSFSNEERIFG